MEMQNNKILKMVVFALMMAGLIGVMIYICPQALILISLISFFAGVLLLWPAFGDDISRILGKK